MSEPLPDWAPEDVDVTLPSAARMYDYYLGGAHNFGADRELARKVLAVVPDLSAHARANRAFLHRAVRFLVDQGVRQFIDVGSGIPTEGNVHESARQAGSQSRVLYVDHDPVAVAHSERILGDDPFTRVLHADLRRPQEILSSPELIDLIDLSQPVAVLMVAVLHFVSEAEGPAEIIETFRNAVVPGSYLVLSHVTGENRGSAKEEATQLYRSAADQLTPRPRARVAELLTGWEPVEPGLVWSWQWRPDWPDEAAPETAATGFCAVVATRS